MRGGVQEAELQSSTIEEGAGVNFDVVRVPASVPRKKSNEWEKGQEQKNARGKFTFPLHRCIVTLMIADDGESASQAIRRFVASDSI